MDQPRGPPTNPAKTLSMLYKDLILAAGIAADQIPTPMEVVATVEEEVENDSLPVETGSTISLEAAKSCQVVVEFLTFLSLVLLI